MPRALFDRVLQHRLSSSKCCQGFVAADAERAYALTLAVTEKSKFIFKKWLAFEKDVSLLETGDNV